MDNKIVRTLISAALVAISSAALWAGEAEGKLAVSVQPLGFIQMGPIFEGEYFVSPQTAAVAHLRLHSLGALGYVVGEYDQMEASSVFIGGGVHHFFNEKTPGRGLYLGGMLEFGWINGLWDPNERWEKRHEETGAVFATEFGYRWKIDRFIVSAGVYLGAYAVLHYEQSYADSSYSSDIEEGGGKTVPFGMAVLSLGFMP